MIGLDGASPSGVTAQRRSGRLLGVGLDGAADGDGTTLAAIAERELVAVVAGVPLAVAAGLAQRLVEPLLGVLAPPPWSGAPLDQLRHGVVVALLARVARLAEQLLVDQAALVEPDRARRDAPGVG